MKRFFASIAIICGYLTPAPQPTPSVTTPAPNPTTTTPAPQD